MTKPVGLCLSAFFVSETFISPGFAGSVDTQLLSSSSLCCNPTPYPLSELSSLLGPSETFARLGMTNCLLIIPNAGM